MTKEEKNLQNAMTEGVIWKQLLLFFFPIVLLITAVLVLCCIAGGAKDRKRKKQCVRVHKRLEQYRKLGYKL